MAHVQYDFKKTALLVGGVPMQSYADGEGWGAEYDNDQSSAHSGVDGDARIIMSNDRTATITIRLADYSVSNAVLSALFTAGLPFPVSGVDLTSNADILVATQCQIKKVPRLAKGNEATMNEWTLTALKTVIVHTGAKSAPF